jgi:hypothetical protein
MQKTLLIGVAALLFIAALAVALSLPTGVSEAQGGYYFDGTNTPYADFRWVTSAPPSGWPTSQPPSASTAVSTSTPEKYSTNAPPTGIATLNAIVATYIRVMQTQTAEASNP